MNKFTRSATATLKASLFARRADSAGKHKIMVTLIFPSLLGAFSTILSSSAYAEPVTLPVGLKGARVQLEVVQTGGTVIYNEIKEHPLPAHIVDLGDTGQFMWIAQLDSGNSGLQTADQITRTPIGGFITHNGSLLAELILSDTIIIGPGDCDAFYGETLVTIDCEVEEDTSVAVTPNAQANVQLIVNVGTVDTNVGGATASAHFRMDYGGRVAQASWDRCLAATPGTPIDCSLNPEGDFVGFGVADEDKTPDGFNGLMLGTGAPLELGIKVDEGGIGQFELTMILTAGLSVSGQGDVTADATIFANKTFTYAKSGPVFNLPEGWTAWSTSGLVQNNLYVAPPVFKDGFETSE